jgi:gamma-glutamyl:cysteine ligase YbdK (ATP-grasp superfamily)
MRFIDIANELGYKAESGAFRAVKAGLQKTLQEPADQLRTMEAERLDRMLEGLWEKAITGHTWEVDRVLAIMDRRAKLLGLDSGNAEKGVSQFADSFRLGAETMRQLHAERKIEQ